MDARRTILMLVFVGSIFLLWEAWMRQATPLSAPATPGSVETTASNAASTGALPTPMKPAVEAVPAAVSSSDGVALSSMSSPSQVFTLKNRDLELQVDSQGARFVGATLKDQASDQYPGGFVRLFDQADQRFYEAQTGLVGAGPNGKSLPNHTLSFQPMPLRSEDAPERTLLLSAEAGGLKLIKRISLAESGHQVRIQHTVLNTGADTVTPTIYLQFLRNGDPAPGESSFYKTFTGPAIYTEQGKFEKVDFSDIEKGRRDYVQKANDGWVSIVQHYFVSAWVVQNQAAREFYTRKVGENRYAAGVLQAFPAVAPGAQQTHETILYVGPQVQRVLETLAPGLDLVVDYSWLTFIAKPIYWLLELLYQWVPNWGWAIVLLTIIIKALFYPLSAASYKSMAKMKAVAPRMTALRERYGEDKAKFNQAMMELYKTEKINPLGGCLPIFIQIPVFLALYWVLLASVEMRNAPWILWITDLAAPDPYYILPIVMAATMFLQTKLNPPPPDPLQAKIMLFLPLVFSVFFFFFPAGLVLYWLVNNVVSIAQQWFIMKRMNVPV
ncbi:MAG: membrane protein insertase YidC [Burkholderiaceae bacterium]